jgi:hypothetical protein
VFAPASSSGTDSHFFARWRVEPEIEDLGATVRYHSSDGSDPPTFELDEPLGSRRRGWPHAQMQHLAQKNEAVGFHKKAFHPHEETTTSLPRCNPAAMRQTLDEDCNYHR